jgi:hypothetical protein
VAFLRSERLKRSGTFRNGERSGTLEQRSKTFAKYRSRSFFKNERITVRIVPKKYKNSPKKYKINLKILKFYKINIKFPKLHLRQFFEGIFLYFLGRKNLGEFCGF